MGLADALPPALACTHGACLSLRQYGCVVFWGLEPEEEKFFLDVIRPFEEDPLSEEAQVPPSLADARACRIESQVCDVELKLKCGC